VFEGVPALSCTYQDFTLPFPLPILIFNGFLDNGILGKLINRYFLSFFFIKK
jgi:hypothetical protein